MDIVIGRGRKRQKIELPHGAQMAAFAKQDPQAYEKGLVQVCEILGIRRFS